MSERTAEYTVSPGLGPDAVAVVPPTEDLPVWCQVNVEKWYRELTALQSDILRWYADCTVPASRRRAWQLADAAAIAAVRPDLVQQGRTLKYLAEEFAALKARAT